jgi:hypothetical protein
MTTVTLRQLTDEEYAGYRARALPEYADELVRSRGLSPKVAAEQSATTFPATVADVVAEEGASISRVLTDDEQPVGWLWRLNVFGWNSSAQALYRSLGYRSDAIQMSKPLEEPT